jgi:predicted permease
VGIDAAQTEMSTIMGRLERRFPDRLEGWGVRLESLHTSIVGDVTQRLTVFLAAVALLLVIAVVNVANLMLARAITRFRELAVRSAMGAGRLRLVRQLAAESMVIALLAGALGVAVASGITRSVVHFAPPSTPRLDAVHVDLSTIAFAALVSVIVGIVVSGWPAFRVARRDLVDTLRESSRGTSGGRGARRMRHAFLIAQLSLAVVLAIGAALLVKSFERLAAVDPGYQADDALVATINAPSARYPEPQMRGRFFLQLVERMRAVPGVTAVGASTQLPLDGYSISFSFWPEGTALSEPERPSGDFRAVTPGYFEAMEIPLRRGRVFTDRDAAESPPVVVIEETLARAHFGDVDPVGRRIHLGYGRGHIAREIIGVVGAVRQRALNVDVLPGYYVPVSQIPWSTLRVVVRSSLDPVRLTSALKREVAAIDPLIAVRGITTLSDRFDRSVGAQRFNMLLLAAFAAVAVLLATAGVYSVMSQIVAQLTRDIGVRMALGARASEVRRSVALRALSAAAVGAALGLAISIALTPRLSELLFQVEARDPLAFALAPVLLLLVALLGSYVPARRASDVDPIVALRSD